MAAEWVPCSSGFIEADVIRWSEGVWQEPRHAWGHAVHIGDRVVIAEVLRNQGEWVDLLVRDCIVASEKPGHKVLPLAKNAAVRRKRHIIEEGNPERLLWSDESVRTSLVSRFLRAEDPSASE